MRKTLFVGLICLVSPLSFAQLATEDAGQQELGAEASMERQIQGLKSNNSTSLIDVDPAQLQKLLNDLQKTKAALDQNNKQLEQLMDSDQ